MKQKFYLTTPIYYVNDRPHVGHAYTTIAADVAARYWRAQNADVHFLVGTDENAQKNVETALKRAGSEPKSAAETRLLTQIYVDEMSALWQETWKHLDITYDDFIRTTEPRHTAAVEKFWRVCEQNGDIYKNTYNGLYCTGCEGYVSESDLADGLCPLHKRMPEKLCEENYFFRLSRYRDALLAHFEKNPDFIQPIARRNEVVAFVRSHADDFSISRQNLAWGIPVPGDATQTVYVWFDALINYISAVGYGSAGSDAQFSAYWPAQTHFVGKDIIKFHCAYWPAMLMSAGLPLPKKIFAHGFFTIDGQKISKSLGNAIDPLTIAADYGIDALRYYVLREISFGEDGDFSFDRMRQRYASELSNDLGNLLLRLTTLYEKMEVHTLRLEDITAQTHETYHRHMRAYTFGKALDYIWDILSAANKRLTDERPWESLHKESSRRTVGELLLTISDCAVLLAPILPQTSAKISSSISIDSDARAILVSARRGAPLFPRLS